MLINLVRQASLACIMTVHKLKVAMSPFRALQEDPGPPLLTPVVRELTRSEGQPPIESQIVAAVVALHNAHLAAAVAARHAPH